MSREGNQNVIERARELKCAGRLKTAAAMLDAELRNADLAPATRAELYTELADVRTREGTWAEADTALVSALAAVAREHDERAAELRLIAHERQAWVRFRQGRCAEAEKIAAGLMENTPVTDANAAVLARVENTLGGVAWNDGRTADAIEHTNHATQLFERAGDKLGAANAYTNLGILHYTRGDWKVAAERFGKSEALRQDLGWAMGRSSNLINLGLLQMSMGGFAQARQTLTIALQTGADAGELYASAHAHLALAHLDLLENKLDGACEHLDAAVTHRGCLCDDDLVQVNWLRALVECDRGGLDRAVKLASDARSMAREANLIESEADACRALGIAYAKRRQLDQAEQCIRESLELAELSADPYRRGLALLELAKIYSTRSDVETMRTRAQRHADNAARVFAQLGAQQDLQHAKALQTRSSC